MLDERQQPWLVKFLGNPQHRRVLINEYLASKLAAQLGLSLPAVGRIRIDEELAQEICRRYPEGSFYGAGVHLGIEFAGGLLPGLVVDLQNLRGDPVANSAELAGIYVFDVWLNNADERQVVFTRTLKQRKRRAVWIDQGFCFGGTEWEVNTPMPRGQFYKPLLRDLHPTLVTDVSEWIEKVQKIGVLTFYELLKELPSSWCCGDEEILVSLMTKLLRRQRALASLIEGSVFRDFGVTL